MRRLIAYISLAFTALVAVGTTFVNVLTKTNSNIEYQTGREITFRVSEKADDENAKSVSKEGTEEIAKEMERRLEVSKITRYQVETVGDDMIKVILSENKNEDYDYIATYLSFNGNLALSYGNDYIVSDEFLTEKDAYIATTKGYPCIVLPVNTDSKEYTNLIEAARTDMNEDKHDYAEETTETPAEGEEAEKTYTWYLYLWYDFVEGKCTFEASQDSSNEYSARVLMKFRVTNDSDDDKQYFPDGKDNKLYTAINLDTDGDGVASTSEKEFAYNRAGYFVNLINAGQLDYDVKVLFNDPSSALPWVEPLVTYSSDSYHLVANMSNTLIATITAIIFVSLLLALYFRINAVSIATLSISSTYIGFVSILLFNAEFNTFGIIGLALVAIASLVSGSIYSHKLKEECYRGRSLKKANTEASKKSLLPILDVNVVLIVIGVFCYIFGGAILRNFGVVTVFGGIASIILNTLGLKGMMYLVTNATCLQGKYHYFGVEEKQVPNILNEEKQSYFGPYAESDFTKRKKPVGVVIGAVLLASVAGLSVFGGLSLAGKTTLFPTKVEELASVIYFETTNESSALKKDATIEEILTNLVVYSGDECTDATAKSVISYVDGSEGEYAFNSYTYTETKDEVTTNYYFYEVKLNAIVDSKLKVGYKTGETPDATDPTKMVGIYDVAEATTFIEGVNEILDGVVSEYDSFDTASITAKERIIYKQNEVDFKGVALGTLVAIAVLGFYFVLRYRLSRGLASFVVALSSSVITCGLLTLLRFASIPSYIMAAVPFIAGFVMMISVIFMNREREIVLEDRTHDNSVEKRGEIAVKAMSSAAAAIIPATIFALYMGVNYFGFGPEATAWIYLAIVVGVIVSAVTVLILYAPISQLFFKMFSGVKINAPKKAKKARVAKVNKSAEPEEAVFIGIND